VHGVGRRSAAVVDVADSTLGHRVAERVNGDKRALTAPSPVVVQADPGS